MTTRTVSDIEQNLFVLTWKYLSRILGLSYDIVASQKHENTLLCYLVPERTLIGTIRFKAHEACSDLQGLAILSGDAGGGTYTLYYGKLLEPGFRELRDKILECASVSILETKVTSERLDFWWCTTAQEAAHKRFEKEEGVVPSHDS